MLQSSHSTPILILSYSTPILQLWSVRQFCLASWRCGSGSWSAATSIHSPNFPDGFSSCLILHCICIYALQGGLVLWCPLSPVAAVMICIKCPLTTPGRRYRPPVGVIVSPLRSEGIWRASKQLSNYMVQYISPSTRLTPCVSDLSRARSTPAWQ